jgi:hypothetical protein
MSSLLQKFNALPRAAQWLAYLAVFIVAFFAIIKPVMNYSDTVSAKASQIEDALSKQNDFASATGGNGGILTALQSVYGTPLRPGGGLKPEAFTRVVDGILENHGITDRTVTERKVRMSGMDHDQASALGVAELDRLILEVTFEAQPDVVVAILAELERAPEVASVSRIKMDRSISRISDDDHLVRATLTPEAWIAAAGASSSGSSSEVGQ